MNKIKIIYDVVRKMKDKETIKGALKVAGLKDEAEIFNIQNTFEKSTRDGHTKRKSNVEIDCDGRKTKLENSIDFQGEGCHGHHHFMNHMHSMHHHNREHALDLKEGLGRITTILGVLSSITLDEKEDGSVILSLNSSDIPEDIKNRIHEIMKKGHENHGHEHFGRMNFDDRHHMCMKEFHSTENASLTLDIYISADREIEKASLKVNGEKKDETNQRHDMKLSAELSFAQ